MTPRYIVCLEPGVWVAPWSGDPGRTLVQQNAQRFKRRSTAQQALNRARKYRPFPFAVIEEVT